MKEVVLKMMIRCLISIGLMIFLISGGFFVMRQLFGQSILSSANELNHTGGISEVREVLLGDMLQYIAIEGENMDNPVCLFLHGGPGLSLPYGISSRHQLETISSHCTVVYWDQRGAGKTYSTNSSDVSFTYEQVEADAKELITYLRREFEVDQIYLIGYSWGSVLGMRLVHEIPEQLYAYFGLSQVVHPLQSEQVLYDWLLDEFESTGHHQLVSSLKQLGQPPYEQASSQETFQQILNQSNAYVKWREGLPNVNVLNWIRQVLACPDLTLKEAYDTLIGASHQTLKQSQYWSQLQAVNLFEEIKEVKIPIYFATGVDDYICSVSLLQSWVEQLQAPKKEVLILDNSAHYFSNEDESIIYQWMKDLIAKKFPQAEEAPDETTVGDIFSNLLQ